MISALLLPRCGMGQHRIASIILCNTAHAITTLAHFSGASRIFVCKILNLAFQRPKADSTTTRILLCVALNRCCPRFTGFLNGVRMSLPLVNPESPIRLYPWGTRPSTNASWILLRLYTVESCTDPGKLLFMYMNLPRASTTARTLMAQNPFLQ